MNYVAGILIVSAITRGGFVLISCICQNSLERSMKQFKRSLPALYLFCVVFVMLILAACGGTEPDVSEIEIEPEMLAEEIDSGDEAVSETDTDVNVGLPTEIPIATVPPATETPLPTATLPPTETPLPTATATADPLLGHPADLWISYGFGDYGLPVLMKKGDQLIQEPLPPLLEMEVFFDYSPDHSLLAFGRQFWEGVGPNNDSVTDLWVYDFKTDQLSLWIEGGVGRATWSSDLSQPPTLAVALHNGETFDLVVAQGADVMVSAVDDVTPIFAWAPEQGRVAFVQDGEWSVINPFTRVTQRTQVTEYDVTQGWIGDTPVWDLETDTLMIAAQPLILAPIENGGVITISNGIDDLFGGIRPTQMLWSAETRQLVAQIEGIEMEVKIFAVSADLTEIEEVASLPDAQLTMWFEEGVSIVVLDVNQEPQVWSLIDYEFVK